MAGTSESAAKAESQAQPRHTNRLITQSSPYLLQHAHNPVDWYPWGPEAFAAARAQDKPIFLSIGYSTCYWCHVMERECFENEQIAAEMNRRFVNIKVDREQRPDVDQLYMTALQVLSRQGGWPMSMFLTPDLKPFYGGTYFPPTDTGGRPGFMTVLTAIADAYRDHPGDMNQSAEQLVSIVQQLSEPRAPERPLNIDRDLVDSLVRKSVEDYDAVHGGFGSAPKFPRQTLLELLLTYATTQAGNPSLKRVHDEPEHRGVLEMVLHTLDALAAGGIRDQLGGAFHRYSTDERWLVPHFEIMLYDNAMLAWLYIEAYRQTERRDYAGVARGIMDFVLREMTSPSGAFYTAFDAEVDAQEGATYLWTAQQIDELLDSDDARLCKSAYGVDQGKNFADPHDGGGRPTHNVLYQARTLAELSKTTNLSEERLAERLDRIRESLYAARRSRPQPMLDRKIITSWNALMIRALAYAGSVLQEQRYLDAAARAADYLLRHHRSADEGLVRNSGGGSGGQRDWASPLVGTTEMFTATPTQPAAPSAGTEPPLPGTSRPSKPVDDASAPAHAAHRPAAGGSSASGFLDDYALLAQALLALHDGSGQEKWRDQAAALLTQMMARFHDDSRGGFYYSERGAGDLFVRQKSGSDGPLPSGNAVAAMCLLAVGRLEEAQRTLAVFAAQMSGQAAGMSAMVQAALQYVRRAGAFTVPAAPGAAEDRPLSGEELAEHVVSVRPEWITATQLVLHLNILSGFHIHGHEEWAGLVATQLAVSGAAAPDVDRIDYPPGEERRFAFSEAPLRVYEGSVMLAVHFARAPQAEEGIEAALRYQPCDQSSCLPAVTRQIKVPPPPR